MKVVILAGGLGSRLGEETSIKPKPMVEIGNKPILWHIMKIYAYYGYTDFVILTGYKNEVIKEYFVNYHLNNANITVDLATNAVSIHNHKAEPWKITMLYTGQTAQTGARIKKAQEFLEDAPFMLTYGDGVGNINIKALLEAHKKSGKLVTLTTYQPEGRFGAVAIDADGAVTHFHEKPKEGGAWINAGFFVCEPAVFQYLNTHDDCIWEQEGLSALSKNSQLQAYKHGGFWHAMDMLKDKEELHKMWVANKAPWKMWDE